MDIRPIFSAMRRHKTTAALIVIEIALSCAILCNAIFLVRTRLELMARPTGLAESEIVRILVTSNNSSKDNAEALTQEDLAALRSVPGVTAAAVANTVPLGSSGQSLDVTLTPGQPSILEASFYHGDRQLLDAMGLKLVAGRKFNADEFVDWKALDAPGSKLSLHSVIVTRALAERLFPGQDAIGKSIYAWNDEPMSIVGVVEHLVQPHGRNDPAFYDYSLMLPVQGAFPNYLLRVADPQRRAEVLKLAVEKLKRIDPNRVIQRQETVEEMRAAYYRQDREMAWLLVVVCVALLAVTAMGIIGLASFWVQQRTRQIGVRRALGATRGQILRYFQTENFLLASVGILLGMFLAYALNHLLMSKYELPRLPLFYLPIGAVALWLLGQVAVLAPARRAASISPAIATRSA